MARVLGLPPRIKVLEALGALADGRVRLLSETEALVTSSDSSREYRVIVDVGGGRVYSNDNGTVHRGYVGYPIIAVLMAKGLLPMDEELAKALSGVPWRRLIGGYGSYAKVMSIIKGILERKGIRWGRVEEFIDKVLGDLRKMRLVYVECLSTNTNVPC